MKKTRFNQKGFTLIEIIIVVVILGILAAFALPKITSNIDKARAAEAFQAGAGIKDAFHRCVDEMTGGIRAAVATDVTACQSYTQLSLSNPSTASTNFNYTLTAGGTVLTITSSPKFTGFLSSDTIVMTADALSGSSSKLCNGRFSTMCKS